MSEKFPGDKSVPEKIDESESILVPEQSLSEQMHGLIEYANLSPEELRAELRAIVERVKILETTSRTDELTGLLNRHGFKEEVQKFEALFAREKRSKDIEVTTTVLAIDLDGFKQVNDTGGHAFGDYCLTLIAENVKKVLRESDVFARVGGDEFILYLADSTPEGTAEVARKIRTTLETTVSEELRHSNPSYQGTLSASIGIASTENVASDASKRPSTNEMIEQADYAVYVVKAAGKKGELTLEEAQKIDADGTFKQKFLSRESLDR